MAYIKSGGKVLSLATPEDVKFLDRRVFEVNELIDDDEITGYLIRSTQRILSMLYASQWYSYMSRSTGATTLDLNKLLRSEDFSELCSLHALVNYIYPMVADWGNPEAAEVVKIDAFQKRFDALWSELVSEGDFYDYNGDGVVSDNEIFTAPVSDSRQPNFSLKLNARTQS